MVRKVENTLYVTDPEAYVRKKHDVLIIEIDEEEVLRVPGHHLGSIVMFGNSTISHFALDWCAKNDVAVTRTTRTGRYIGTWVGPVKGNVLLRINQFETYNSEREKCKISIKYIKGKIVNERAMLLRSARDISNEDTENALREKAEKLDNILNIIDESEDVDQVRGFEGTAAKIYFSSFNDMIVNENDNIVFKKRTKRPPRDIVNAMLSYVYVLLNHDCKSALETVGLDPQIGFLHALRPGKPALALDLMEELRPVLAERLVLTLLNRKQVKEDDFDIRPGGAVNMTEECRKTLINSYQEKKHTEIYHPVLERKVPYGLIPFFQARFLARVIRGDISEYPPFIYN